MRDEPGMDAEKIDAISQLSPETSEYGHRESDSTHQQERLISNGQKSSHVIPSKAPLVKLGAPSEENKNKST